VVMVKVSDDVGTVPIDQLVPVLKLLSVNPIQVLVELVLTVTSITLLSNAPVQSLLQLTLAKRLNQVV